MCALAHLWLTLLVASLSSWFNPASSAEEQPYYSAREDFRQDEVPSACESKVDIAVLLDSSGSIGISNYVMAKKGAAELIKFFAGTPENQQLGLIFSDVVIISVPLTSTGTPLEKYDMMVKSPYLARVTNTGRAVKAATDELKKSKRGVPQAMVVITDGISTDPSILRHQAVPTAKAAGIHMFAVGVGHDIDPKELRFIADPGQEYFAADWKALKVTLEQVAQSICRTS